MKTIFQIIILIFFLSACSNSNKTAKTFIKENNIFSVSENGKEKQLTFNGTDSDPILIKNEDAVIFVRNEKIGYTIRKKLMKVNINDLSESILTDQKPFEDALENSYDIININSPKLSLDGKYVIFVTEKYVTGSQLVKVDIETGKWTELFSAEYFEEIDKEPYIGYFLVGQSDVEDRGRDIYYRLVDSTGKIIKKFSNKESMNQFKAGLE